MRLYDRCTVIQSDGNILTDYKSLQYITKFVATLEWLRGCLRPTFWTQYLWSFDSGAENAILDVPGGIIRSKWTWMLVSAPLSGLLDLRIRDYIGILVPLEIHEYQMRLLIWCAKRLVIWVYWSTDRTVRYWGEFFWGVLGVGWFFIRLMPDRLALLLKRILILVGSSRLLSACILP